MPAQTPGSTPAPPTREAPPARGEAVKAQERPVYRGKEDRRRRRDAATSSPPAPAPASPPTRRGPAQETAPSPPQSQAHELPAPSHELPSESEGRGHDDAPPPPPSPPPVSDDDAPSTPDAPPGLTAADVAEELRAQLRAAELQEDALQEEREGLRAELLQIAQDVRSKALAAEPAKAVTAALRAALADVSASAAQAAARVRELRDRLQRHEGLELVRMPPGVSPHKATLDAVLRGEAPATVGERLAAARLLSLTPEVKTDDDAAAALLTWTGELWGAP